MLGVSKPAESASSCCYGSFDGTTKSHPGKSRGYGLVWIGHLASAQVFYLEEVGHQRVWVLHS